MTKTSPRFIFVICRGGMDGLSLIGRPDSVHLQNLRPTLIPKTHLPASDGFAFHPALKTIHDLFEAKELSFMHAAGLPSRDRSHFKSQDILESGLDTPNPKTGWLGRALAAMPSSPKAVAFGSSIPLVLRGAPDSFNWSDPRITPQDEALLTILKNRLYQPHPALNEAMEQVEDLRPFLSALPRQNSKGSSDGFKEIGTLLAHDTGPDIGVISVDSWDTHDNQDRRITKNFARLDTGIGMLKETLGKTWDNTAILVASEFGRSVAQNGTLGTDHGTGGVVILTGGAAAGGHSLGVWPGLSPANLFKGRDLYPSNNLLDLIAQILETHLGVPSEIIKRSIFPGLVRSQTNLFS